jgi:catechol 2,3-dioxygenase-like lactoylglutathione lyase family enzyme
MTIVLNHTIVPAHDKEISAKFFARIFGLSYQGPLGHFAPVRINESLTLDFDDAASFDSHHYAFHVSDEEFDSIWDRIKANELPFGSGPFETDNMHINTRLGGRGLYFLDPNGHNLELMTRT